MAGTQHVTPSLACLVVLMCVLSPALTTARKNILFLVSDDMRPQLGAYVGRHFPSRVSPKMYTPNLDALASRSLLLGRAYVQQAVCSPSRTSLLTGRRPDTTHVHDLIAYFRRVGGNFTTIPQYFKEHGYVTTGMGKIFHPGVASGYDDPMSWTEKYFHANSRYWKDYSHYSWYAANESEVNRHPLQDDLIADHAVDTLKRLAPAARSEERPFFVAVGFHRPHLPFLFPARFLKYYPETEVRLPDNDYAPVGLPEIAWSDFDELRSYVDIKDKYGYGAINTTLPPLKVRQLRRAYYAAISYVDSLVGRVLAALDQLGLANDTIVSFWGDHGWQLGEHGEWCKHTNFELATHAPMMVRVPGLTDHGAVTDQLTEFVDLFPTLADAAGLPPVPLCPENSTFVRTCSEGVSLVPLMRDPTRRWKTAAFSQYPRMEIGSNIYMGYSMRTDRYRYTEWMAYEYLPIPHRVPSKVYPRGHVELYDHSIDPEENINRAIEPAYGSVVKRLHVELLKGWRAALPPHNVTHA